MTQPPFAAIFLPTAFYRHPLPSQTQELKLKREKCAVTAFCDMNDMTEGIDDEENVLRYARY